MPLINGQKMACEPCIRGHRSTKCTHANERLMVPVRKPGRPLSTCPHPPARGCGCGGVTAAIPRKQKCNCGSSDSTDGEKPIKVETPTSDTLPTSPTKASATPGTSYRIQKSTSKANSRKPSFGPAQLERVDASQVNILPAFEQAPLPQVGAGMPMMGTPTPRPSMDYGQMPLMGTNSTLQNPMAYQVYHQPMAQIMVPPEMQSPGVITPITMPQAPNSATQSKPVSTGGSCCSGSKSAKATPPTSTESSPKVEPKPKTGGCCSSKSPPPLQVNNAPSMASHGIAIPPFQTPVALGHQVFPAYMPHPTLFTYPAHYGSYMSPLQPEQWKQTIEALQYGQPAPPPAGFNVVPSVTYSNGNAGVSTGSADGITSHMCTCGEGCQCVGCAAHPYNQATQDYVRSAWESMGDDTYSHASGVNSVNGVHGTTTPITSNGNGTAHAMISPQHLESGDNSEKVESPVAAETPSEGTSGIHEELSASDFFFVTYPFGGDSCSGETASCPCGDECQCLGCSIHNNNAAPFVE